MKKIIALFVIMLGFGFTATAQQKKATAKPAPAVQAANPNEAAFQKAAIKDVKDLNAFIKLNDADTQSLMGLFEYKHRTLAENLSAERKAIVSQTIEAKLRATFNPEQMAKLDSNKELLNKLTH